MKRFWIRRGLRFVAFALLFIGLMGLAVMSLWNALLPGILGVSAISFGQALGLLVLSRLLFGGFRGPWGRAGFGPGGYDGPGRNQWKQKMADRWKNLTPEQREKMRQKWDNRCGNRGGWHQKKDDQEQSAPGQSKPDEPVSDSTTI